MDLECLPNVSLSIVVLFFKGKGDIWNCCFYRAVLLLEHGMKVVESVLEKRLHRIVTVDEMQFGLRVEQFMLCVS